MLLAIMIAATGSVVAGTNAHASGSGPCASAPARGASIGHFKLTNAERKIRSGPGTATACTHLSTVHRGDTFELFNPEVRANGFIWNTIKTANGYGWIAVRHTNNTHPVVQRITQDTDRGANCSTLIRPTAAQRVDETELSVFTDTEAGRTALRNGPSSDRACLTGRYLHNGAPVRVQAFARRTGSDTNSWNFVRDIASGREGWISVDHLIYAGDDYDDDSAPSRCVPEPVEVELPYGSGQYVSRPIKLPGAVGYPDAGCSSPTITFSAGDQVFLRGVTDSFFKISSGRHDDVYIERGAVNSIDLARIMFCEHRRADFTNRFIEIYLANDHHRGYSRVHARNLVTFRNLVQTNAQLDIKNNEPILERAREAGCGVWFFGRVVAPDVPGNVLYGMVGYRFFRNLQNTDDREFMLVAAAGAAQSSRPFSVIEPSDWADVVQYDPACDTYAVLAGTSFEKFDNTGAVTVRNAAEVRRDLTQVIASGSIYLNDEDYQCVGSRGRLFPEFRCSGTGHPYGTYRGPDVEFAC